MRDRGVLLTGLAAVRHYGFQVPESHPIDVVVPVDVRRQEHGFVRVQRNRADAADVVRRGRDSAS